jgi:hypothetical protein
LILVPSDLHINTCGAVTSHQEMSTENTKVQLKSEKQYSQANPPTKAMKPPAPHRLTPFYPLNQPHSIPLRDDSHAKHQTFSSSSSSYNQPFKSNHLTLPFPVSQHPQQTLTQRYSKLAHHTLSTLAIIWLVVLQGIFYISNNQAAFISSLVLLPMTFLAYFWFKGVDWVIVGLLGVVAASGAAGCIVGGVGGSICFWVCFLASSWAVQRMVTNTSQRPQGSDKSVI